MVTGEEVDNIVWDNINLNQQTFSKKLDCGSLFKQANSSMKVQKIECQEKNYFICQFWSYDFWKNNNQKFLTQN